MEEISIVFTPEITKDITKELVSKRTIDFIINFEDELLTLEQLEEMKKVFLKDEFYFYVDAVSRAIKAITIIFE